jgi:O-acetyl-ADP-ribose deacetylase (regulator of RNase III)
MWAMLLAVRQHNLKSEKQINIIACPGPGTATGQVPYRQAARQMALAYEHFLNPPKYIDWHFADKRQKSVRYGGNMGFRFPPEIDVD